MLTPEQIDAIDLNSSPAPSPNRSIGGKILSPQEIDQINDFQPGPNTATIQQPDNRLPQMTTTQGGPPVQVGEGNLEQEAEDLPVSGPAMRILATGGRTLGLAGRGVASIAEDIAEAPAQVGGYQEPLRNLRALGTMNPEKVLGGQEQVPESPFEKETPQYGGVQQFLRGTYSQLAKDEPKFALLPLAGESLAAQAAASGGLFGIDENGNLQPKQAAVMALLPGVGKYARLGTASILGRAAAAGVKGLENPVVQKTLEEVGHQVALDSYMILTSAPELVQQYQNNPKQALASLTGIVAQNLGFALLGGNRFTKDVSSDTQNWIKETAKEMANNNIKAKIVQDYSPSDLADIYAEGKSGRPDVPDWMKNLASYIDKNAPHGVRVSTTVVDTEKLTDFWKKYTPSISKIEVEPVQPQPQAQTGPEPAGSKALLTPGEIDAIPAERPNANSQPSTVEEAGGNQAGSVPTVPAGSPGEVPKPAQAGQPAEAPKGPAAPEGQGTQPPTPKPETDPWEMTDEDRTKAGYKTIRDESGDVVIIEDKDGNDVPPPKNLIASRTIAKRASKTKNLTDFLRGQGIEVDKFLKNPNDHVTHVDQENDGSYQVRIEHHHPEGTVSSELVNVRKGESLSNPGRPKFIDGKGTMIVRPDGSITDPMQKPSPQGVRITPVGTQPPSVKVSSLPGLEPPSVEEAHKGTPATTEANVRVRVQLKDGTVIPALWNGYYEAPGTKFDGKLSLAFLKEGSWSHGGQLPEGAKILDKIPTFEEWKKAKESATTPVHVFPKDATAWSVLRDRVLAQPSVQNSLKNSPQNAAQEIARQAKREYGKLAVQIAKGEIGGKPALHGTWAQSLNSIDLGKLAQAIHDYALRQQPAEKPAAPAPKARKAGDLEGMTEAELDAMLDEAEAATKKPAAPAPAPAPAPKQPAIVDRDAETAKRLGISRDQYKDMATLNSYQQQEKYGTTIAKLHEKYALEKYGNQPPTKPKGSSIRKKATKTEQAQAPASAPGPKEKTAKDIIAEAAKAGVTGIDEAVKGLHELFGGGTHMGSEGPGFDEETYKKAKPHFENAWEQYKKAGKSIADFFKYIFQQFGNRIRPYIKRFIQDLQAEGEKNKVTTDDTATRGSNVGPGSGPNGGTVSGPGGESGNTKPGKAEGASGSVGGTNVETSGTPGEGGNGATGGEGDSTKNMGGTGEPGVQPGQAPTPSPESAAGGKGVSPKVETAAKPAKARTQDPNARNHVIQPGDTLAPKGRVGKLTANINAIQLVKKLQAENRNATPEEKKQLAQYTGWGSLSQAFDEGKGEAMIRSEKNPSYWNPGLDEKWVKDWGKWYKLIKQTLTDDEWRAAARSTQYAHFTSRDVVTGMWNAAGWLGFGGGKVAERAAGIGNFIGLAPEALQDNADFIAIERDPISAQILAKLYPEATVFNKDTAEVKIPTGSVDLEITNVPFSDRIVEDKRYPVKLNLHNWFIAKMLDDVKPGGLVITVTTGHTMDSQAAMRAYLANRAELIGAVRLPNNAFKENAGTEVTTDVLFLRKPMTPTPQIGQPWTNLKQIKTHDGKPVMVNEYFADHPEMILGKPSLEGTMHAGREEYATLPFEDKNLRDLFEQAIQKLPKDVFEREPAQSVDFAALGQAQGIKENTLVVRDKGTLAVVKGGNFVDPKEISTEFKSPERVRQGRQYVELSNTYRDLLAKQVSETASEQEVEAARKKLNEVYDEYAKKYGPIGGKKSALLDFERNYYLLVGLEREDIQVDPKTDKVTKRLVKADVFTKRTSYPKIEPQTAQNVTDALQISLSFRGRIDMPYMASLLSRTEDDVEKEMLSTGAAFRNPESNLLETPEQYLSGNVRTKLHLAQAAAADNEAYKPNVDALVKVQPAIKPFRKIGAIVGSTWMQPEMMTQFAKDLFRSKTGGITYNKTGDIWVVGGFEQTPELTQRYGIKKRDGEELLAAMLNQKTVKIYKTALSDKGNEIQVLDDRQTQAAQTAMEKIQDAFQSWIAATPERQRQIEQDYNNAVNNWSRRVYEVPRLDLPGASSEVSFRANQRNGIWRFVQERHGVGAETVGAGKTYIEIATSLECRRLKLAQKPMMAVMNSTLGQFAQSARKLYPGANLLVAGRDDLSKERRKTFLGKIASGDWDSIIIPHSQFNMLDDDPEWQKQILNNLVDELKQAIDEARGDMTDKQAKKDPTVKQLEKQKEKYENKLRELANRKKEDILTFQDLGIDLLIIDEAHEFKKPPFTTKRDRIAGLNKEMSERALSLFLKARFIQSKQGGRGVIGFTGTPVTNTLGETWHMLNLFSPHILKEFGVETFDRFLSTFTRVKTEFDVNAVGKLVVKDKLSRFINQRELAKMIQSSWDVVTQDQLRPILEAQGETYPKIKGGKAQAKTVPLSPNVMEFNKFLERVYDAYNGLRGMDKKLYSYIPALCFGAGKAAALDIRLVDPTAADDPHSKVNEAVKNIFRIWQETADKRSTQAVFLDQMNEYSTDALRRFADGRDIEFKDSGDSDEEEREDLFLYKDIRAKLVKLGIPEKEILIANEHDTKGPDAFILFDKINRGDVRIVIGSTAKIGVGVNMQKKMIAVHHLDLPWFPALLEQRNGRIERSGNENPEIQILYYGMEKTADAGLYAKNEAKAKFSSQVLSGNVDADEIDDPTGPLIMSMAEQMAALSGDPMIFEKVQLENRIRTLKVQQEAFIDEQENKKRTKEDLVGRISDQLKNIAHLEPQYEWALANLSTLGAEEPKIDAVIGGTPITEKKALFEAMDAVMNRHAGLIRRGLEADRYDKPKGTGYFQIGPDGVQKIGKINGAEIQLLWDARRVMDRDEKGNQIFKDQVEPNWFLAYDNHGVANENKLPTGHAATPIGIYTNLEDVPSRIKADIDGGKAFVERAKAEIAEIDQLLQSTFAGQKELNESEARYAQLKDEVFTGQTPKAQKAADVLFETGMDPEPLMIRLRRAVAEQEMKVNILREDSYRAAGRWNLSHPEDFKTPKEFEAFRKQALQKHKNAKEAVIAGKNRLNDLVNRLKIVEKANYEAQIDAERWLVGYGRTPTRHPGLAYHIEPPDTSDQVSRFEEAQSRGIDELEAMLKAGKTGLSAEAVRVALDLLQQPVMRGLDWSNLTVAIKHRIGSAQAGMNQNGRFSGLADVANDLIELSAGARAETFPHEVFHFLYEMLPDADKERIAELRLEAMQKAYDEAKTDDEKDAILQYIQSSHPGMTSNGFVSLWQRVADQYPGVDLSAARATMYRLTNGSEFLAHVAGDTFKEQSSAKAKEGWFDGFLNRIKGWLRGLLDSLKRFMGTKPDIQQIIREMLAGKNLNTPERGLAAERAVAGSLEPDASAPPPDNAGADVSSIEVGDEIARALDEDDEKRKTTKVFGRVDTILGREGLGPAERAAGADYAKAVFEKAGLQVEQQPNGLWKLADDGFESETEGRLLLNLLRKEISTQYEEAKAGRQTGYLGNLLNSVVENMAVDRVTAFSPELKRQLYSVSQGERSMRGIMLAALGGFSKTVQYVARNVDVVLSKTYSDAFGGEMVRTILERAAAFFKDFLTESEMEDAMKSYPKFVDAVQKMMALNRREEGGRLYRKVQALLKPKGKKSLGKLEGEARIQEAADFILEHLKKEGIEPKPSPNKPLSPLHKLLLMVTPSTAGKIDKAIANAIGDAERNAGIKEALRNAETDEERDDLRDRFSAGEEPTPEDIEAGLEHPEFVHWKVLRDNLLDYSPVTLRLAQKVIAGDFRGTRFNPQKDRPADTRIDLEKLAKMPHDEVQRVLDAYMTNLNASMDMAHATDYTRQRVAAMVEKQVTDQLEAARRRAREPMFQPPKDKAAQLTPEQRIGQMINAGLLGDERLDLPEMVQQVAAKSTVQKLTPKLTSLIQDALNVPFYRQDDIGKHFAQELTRRLGITPEQAAKAQELFNAAFDQKFATARQKAAKAAQEALTPAERKEAGPRKALWKKIAEATNAGVFDSGDVLRNIARAHGWNVPSHEEVQKMHDLAEQLQRLQELTPAEQAQAGDNPKDLADALAVKKSATSAKRIEIRKAIETRWARMVRPISFRHWWATRQNIAAAMNEFEVANLLLKVGFPVRLATHITTQLAAHTPTRAIAEALVRFVNDKDAGRETRLWGDLFASLRDAYSDTVKAVVPALQAARSALAGRAESRNVDRLLSGVQAIDRMSLAAEEAAAAGDNVKAGLLKFMALIRVSLRITQALDNFQGTPAEAQEMRAIAITALRENGRTPAEAEAVADQIIGNANDEMPKAAAEVAAAMRNNGIDPSPARIIEAARELVKARQLARMAEFGLPADDFAERLRLLRRVIAWQERVTTGPGGLVAWAGKAASSILQDYAGLPLSFTRFSNAFGTGINYMLMFTPLYGIANARMAGSQPSPWFGTPTDRMQRRVQALMGSMFGTLMFILFATGGMIARLTWPTDRRERELLEASGHRLGTVEVPVGPGKFIPFSLSTGPFSLLAPYIAAGSSLHDLLVKREKAQQELEKQAEEAGLPAGKIRPIDTADLLGVALAGAERSLMGGRTAVGLTASITEYGVPNSRKTVAAYLSPLVPGLPAYQELSRMAGVNLDSKIASVWDFMVPLPTSQARAVNLLGDPVQTPDTVQRLVQTITAGTYPAIVNEERAKSQDAYAALFNSGYRPPVIDPNKGFAIDGEWRPMTDAELVKYTTNRGQMFKAGLSGMADADPTLIKSVFNDANEQALQSVGVNTAIRPSSAQASSGSGGSGASSILPQNAGARFVPPGSALPAVPAGGSGPRVSTARTGAPRTPGRSLRVGGRRVSAPRGVTRGPSLRRGSGLRSPGVRTGVPRGNSVQRSLRPRIR